MASESVDVTCSAADDMSFRARRSCLPTLAVHARIPECVHSCMRGWIASVPVCVRGFQVFLYACVDFKCSCMRAWISSVPVCVRVFQVFLYACVDCKCSCMRGWIASVPVCVGGLQVFLYACVDCSCSCMRAWTASVPVCVRGLQVSVSMACVPGIRRVVLLRVLYTVVL